MVTAAVIVGAGAVIGGVVSGEASKKAAATGAAAQERAASTVSEAANKARSEVLELFPLAQSNLLVGAQSAIDVFGAGIPLQQKQLQAGNLQAQQTTAGGFDQQRAALLGLNIPQFSAGAPIITGEEEPLLGGSIVGNKRFIDLGSTGSAGIPGFVGTGTIPGSALFEGVEDPTARNEFVDAAGLHPPGIDLVAPFWPVLTCFINCFVACFLSFFAILLFFKDSFSI